MVTATCYEDPEEASLRLAVAVAVFLYNNGFNPLFSVWTLVDCVICVSILVSLLRNLPPNTDQLLHRNSTPEFNLFSLNL